MWVFYPTRQLFFPLFYSDSVLHNSTFSTYSKDVKPTQTKTYNPANNFSAPKVLVFLVSNCMKSLCFFVLSNRQRSIDLIKN